MRKHPDREIGRAEPLIESSGWLPSIGVALASTALFLMVRISLTPLIGNQTPYVVFVLAVAAAAWYAGWRAGVLSIVTSLAVGHRFFVAPFPKTGLATGEEAVRVSVFAGVCLVLVLLSHETQTGRRKLRRLLSELEAERAKYRSIVESVPAAMMTLKGDDMVYEHANEVYLRLRGRGEVLGKPLRVAVPDAEEQGFPQMIRQVMATGEPQSGKSAVFETEPGPDGASETRYFDFSYVPVRDGRDKIDTVLCHAVDVTERVKAERELAEAKEQLERRVEERTAELQASNDSLRGFTYHVSHDLRSPLRTIVSSSTIIQEDFGEGLPQEAKDLLSRQATAAKRLGVLIDDLLRYARLAQADISRQNVDLSALAEGAAQEALSAHPSRAVGVEVQPGLAASADPSLVRLAVGNLIENAVKYSPNGGTVRVGRRDDGTFFVSDEGIGIEEKYFGLVFEAFQRLHRDGEFEGTGIGLANVKQIVERHGGQVWVESELGKGSTFLFTLG